MSRRWLLLTAAAVLALSWPARSQGQTNQDESKGKQHADQAQTEVVPSVYSNPLAYFNPFVVPWLNVVPAVSVSSGAYRSVFSSYPPAPAGNILPRTTRNYTYRINGPG